MALIASSPLLAVVALFVAATSKGPVLFRQKRVGRNGRLFELKKFRTMREAQGLQVTAKDDARVTVIGKILRKTKLDELPELWNVLAGEMSLVGPRPEVEKYVDLQNPTWKSVLNVRPGITDPVTLQLRNEEELLASVNTDREKFYLEVLQPLKLEGYLDYLKQRSWRSDLQVLYHTAIAVVLPSTTPIPPVNQLTALASKSPWLNR